MRTRRLEMPASPMLERAKKRARLKRVAFSLERKDIIIPERCPALGIRLMVGGARSDQSPSLDRVIPDAGYVKGNVRVISDRANRLKGTATLAQLRERMLHASPDLREDYRLLVEYVEREELLHSLRERGSRPGKAGREWREMITYLDRIFETGIQNQRFDRKIATAGPDNDD